MSQKLVSGLAISIYGQSLSLFFPSQTAIDLDQHALTDIALFPDNALESLGEIIRKCFVKLAIPTQSLYQLLVLLGKKIWREQNYRHLAHHISPHHALGISTHQSVGMSNLQVNGDSALIGNSALRAHVARAVGIELAHSEGQYWIPFPWDMRKVYDSIKAHLLIPQLVARGYPLEVMVLGSLTHISPRCLQVGNGYSDIITVCASSILAGCLYFGVCGSWIGLRRTH